MFGVHVKSHHLTHAVEYHLTLGEKGACAHARVPDLSLSLSLSRTHTNTETRAENAQTAVEGNEELEGFGCAPADTVMRRGEEKLQTEMVSYFLSAPGIASEQ